MLAYNAASDPVSKNYYTEDQNGALVLFDVQTSVYNAQHRPVTDSIYGVAIANAPYTRYRYTYNVAGQLSQSFNDGWTGSAWFLSQRTSYAYNAAGFLRAATYDNYASGAWTPEYKDSFVYAGSNPSFIAEYGYLWNAATSTWTPQYRGTFHLNAAGNHDTLTYEYYDPQTSSWGNLSQFTITYNSYNNWETVTDAYDDDGNGVINAGEVYGTTRYYYELWDNALAVPTASTATSRITLSPNPTTDWLRIGWTGGTAPHSFTLTDAGGRTVRAGAVAAQRSGVDLSALPAGLYIFTAVDAAGAVMHREKVVRQ